MSRTAHLCLFATVATLCGVLVCSTSLDAQKTKKKPATSQPKVKDAKNVTTGEPAPEKDPEYAKYAIFENSAPRAETVRPASTTLPLKLAKEARIAFIGNGLLEQTQFHGYFETFLHQKYPNHNLKVRNLCWSADTPELQPRPENFADINQHLTYEKIDVIFASYGFNESFAGHLAVTDFEIALTKYVSKLKSSAFNGKTGPQIILVSPIANEDIEGVPASKNNKNIRLYAEAVKRVAIKTRVGFVDVYKATAEVMAESKEPITLNGVHLNEDGYEVFSRALFQGTFDEDASDVNEQIRELVVDKNRQYFRRYRPLNTFYYTGGRKGSYGYLDFLPAMKNFDLMVQNRDARLWALAQGEPLPQRLDDSNLPEMPETAQSRGANEWMTADDELKAFKIDPRFEVNLFAGEEQFPDIGAPIQMRWDSRGRLWVSCSTTYPHVYPMNEPNDKIVILEDTDGDGKADKSTVFADDLHIPLSFEFGDGGIYVSEMPHLTFLKDTDGDDKADVRKLLLTGFGTEDSHHSLHDFSWTPDGDLIFRESIFHHSQVETPYGPVRQQNSGWFRFEPDTHRLTSFGTYHSTNPWGVTFDDWGNHVASHPVFAAAFHSLDPPYPDQHPKPAGLRAYSGTCGHEFVDFATFPEELQGGFIKARYKPTNRIEIHKWVEGEFGYDEEYVSDLIFSTNLSFIPVDLRYGPRGAMYVCDWYNPVKGHAQYSLRDERRDRQSGRIWRITAKGHPVQEAPNFAEMSISELVEMLARPEYRYRYWAKRELRERDHRQVEQTLKSWASNLDKNDPRYRHHQMEVVWALRWIEAVDHELLRDLLSCQDHHARAAATQQLRYWHPDMPDATKLLRKSANDSNGLVRMEAAIAASYIGSIDALDAMLDVLNHPSDGHLAYAIRCSLGSHTLRPHWENDPNYNLARLMKKLERSSELKEPAPTASEAQFDSQKNLKVVKIGCVPERMRFTEDQIALTNGQPVKIVFSNPDATDHNLVIVKPGALEEVGMAANAMAKDPQFANSDFIPAEKKALILEASPMIGPTRKSQVHVLRFVAPKEPGIYPFVCTFPGHWVIMNGSIAVGSSLEEAEQLLAESKPQIVKEWTMTDFAGMKVKQSEDRVMRGMQAFLKARCHQCHVVGHHGVKIGPELTEVSKDYRGEKLLQQILEPSSEINKKYQTHQFILDSGKVLTGVIAKETENEIHLLQNLLLPTQITILKKKGIDEQFPSKISAMPKGLADVLQKDEILDMLSFLEAGGYKLPEHLKDKAGPGLKPGHGHGTE